MRKMSVARCRRAELSSRWSHSILLLLQPQKIVFLSPRRFMTGIRIENCVMLPLDDDFEEGEWERWGDNMDGVLKDLYSSRARLFYCRKYMCEIFSSEHNFAFLRLTLSLAKLSAWYKFLLRSEFFFFTGKDKLFLLHRKMKMRLFLFELIQI